MCCLDIVRNGELGLRKDMCMLRTEYYGFVSVHWQVDNQKVTPWEFAARAVDAFYTNMVIYIIHI